MQAGHLITDPIYSSEGLERVKEGRRERVNIIVTV